MHTTVVKLSRGYIARDPRTGEPLRIHRKRRKDSPSFVPEDGPWMALKPNEIMNLAEGSASEINVRWRGKEYTLKRKDGIRALSSVPQSMILPAHRLMLAAFEDKNESIRCSALQALPEFAIRKSDEMFDWLSVLLDDDSANVRKAASHALERSAPTFPSGVQSSLENELRSHQPQRQQAAWNGLTALCDTWPDVVADHIDTLLLEEDVQLRRKAVKLLKRIVSRNSASVWDLISWALNDADNEVRRIAAHTLPTLARHDTKMATLLSERAVVDSDSEVRLAAIKAIQTLDKDHGRARDLIMAGTRSKDVRVRKACIELMPRFVGEDELRLLANDLLKSESDPGLIQTLSEMTFDSALEGTEAQKNASLSPALPIPELEKEIAQSLGKSFTMQPHHDEAQRRTPLVHEQEKHATQQPNEQSSTMNEEE